MYGGRPLGTSQVVVIVIIIDRLDKSELLADVRFSTRWHTFSQTAAKGGQVAPMQADATA